MTSLQFDDAEMMYLLTEESDISCRKRQKLQIQYTETKA